MTLVLHTYTSHPLSHTPRQESVENRIFHIRSALDPTDSVDGKKLCLHQSCGNRPAIPMSADTSSLQGKHVDLPPAVVGRNIPPEIILQLIMVHASTCVPKHNLLHKPHSYNLTSFQIYKIRYLRRRVWNVPDIPFYDGNLWLLHEELVHYFHWRFYARLPLRSYVN